MRPASTAHRPRYLRAKPVNGRASRTTVAAYRARQKDAG